MLIKLSKMFYAILVMYYGWFQVIFFQIPNMLLILGALMIGCIIAYTYLKEVPPLKYITLELFLWILFAFTSLVFGFFVAHNIPIMINSLFTNVEFLILIYGIVFISEHDKNIEFFINTFTFFSIICSITTIFFGVDHGGGRVSMGFNSNPNGVGIIMAIGVCCVLYKMNMKKIFYSIFLLLIICLLLYTAILSGSRKSFLGIVLIIAYWILFVAFKEVKGAKLKGILLLALMFIVGYSISYELFHEAVLFQRLDVLFTSGDETRTGMYDVAFELFKQSPIVGIGFNNYRIISGYGTYSHSTYAEALACTGLIGVILYFSSYLVLIKKYWKLYFNKNLNSIIIRQSRAMLGLFLLLLFLGIGVIHFYEMSSNIAFGMIIAFSIINEEYIHAKKDINNN